jgi:hypothetical protein
MEILRSYKWINRIKLNIQTFMEGLALLISDLEH